VFRCEQSKHGTLQGVSPPKRFSFRTQVRGVATPLFFARRSARFWARESADFLARESALAARVTERWARFKAMSIQSNSK